ncbi:uncharacterized protein E5676_scaffold880G00030 [Cucumis melo var. makuwa]|uniref:Gag-protease polyprotein n=1 Tax=Cucumis melo var. makuwa TaxID=1194695 RepID=A0A5D3DZK7_CUCMM|nr:uncharacterized protein E5676_scaffold880G00030 [Cucumis melo var. makuwa]
MVPRGRPRQVRQVATDVPATRSINRAQAFGEMSSNPHELVGRGAEEGMFDCFPQKLDKRFSIERNKFMSLVQGDMIVIEYEKQFIELAMYALAFANDEVDKCKQFEEGLRAKT